MKVPKKIEYALKALIDLSFVFENHPVMLITEIAQKERIPQKYLEQILLQLKNGGILDSKRGVRGGYFLARSPALVSVGDVFRVMDGTADIRSGKMEDEKLAVLSQVLEDMQTAVFNIIDNISLKDLLAKARTIEEKRKAVQNYAI